MAATVHVREHKSVLAAAEKRALVWIARRLPARVSSDHLTLLALVSMMGAGAAVAATRIAPWAVFVAIACLIANWFGDSLDGTLARVRRRERPRYGYYVDHVIDLAGTTCLLAGLAHSGLTHPLIALGLLASYLLVCAESYLATHATGTFRISFLGVGPTELRIVLAAGLLRTTASPEIVVPWAGAVRLFDLGGTLATAGLAIAFAVSAAANARTLFRAEPLTRIDSAGCQ
jgi:phosphatidylglycerophosphate synthase